MNRAGEDGHTAVRAKLNEHAISVWIGKPEPTPRMSSFVDPVATWLPFPAKYHSGSRRYVRGYDARLFASEARITGRARHDALYDADVAGPFKQLFHAFSARP